MTGHKDGQRQTQFGSRGAPFVWMAPIAEAVSAVGMRFSSRGPDTTLPFASSAPG
jgi:hypothetical protein